MNAESDHQLLHAYAVRRDEAAFRELVRRYTDFVYSAALRQVESDATARDLTQGVFTDLARRAGDILDTRSGESLAGWLHRATRYAALNHRRDTHRRRENERQAMEQLLTNSESSGDWEQIRPALDEALDSLEQPDREAILLRFFKDQDFRTVGVQLGVSDDTAQKRVSRAVERLREFFAKRGVSVGAGGLVVVISANAVQAAPVGLAVAISAAALTGTATTTSTIIAATKTIAMTTLQKTLVTATVAVLAGAGIYEARQAAQLRDQVQTLQQQQAPLAEQIQEMQRERDAATNRAAWLAGEIAKGKNNNSELLKLRGEVGVLKQQLAATSNPKISPAILATGPDTSVVSVTNLPARVERLKYVLDQMPFLKIPELQFATEKDWQLAAGCAPNLKTDEDFRWAFTQLRGIVEDHFGSMTMRALEKFKKANGGQFPTELPQLQPYYVSAVDSAIFQRYEIVLAKSLPNSHMDDDWVITTKAPVDRSDFREVIDSNGYGHGSHFYSPQIDQIELPKQ